MSRTEQGASREVGAPHVVVVGMMGSGKTTLGHALAKHLARPFRDSDAEIERARGRTGAEIAIHEGVAVLHRLEREVFLAALAEPSAVVVAAAASVVVDAGCREAMGTAIVVWLDAPVGVLAARVATGAHRRAIDGDAAARLAADRRTAFTEVADLRLDARAAPAQLVADVLEHLGPDRC